MVDGVATERRQSAIDFKRDLEEFTSGFNKLFADKTREDNERATGIEESIAEIKLQNIEIATLNNERFNRLDSAHLESARLLEKVSDRLQETQTKAEINSGNIETLKKQNGEQYNNIKEHQSEISVLQNEVKTLKQPGSGNQHQQERENFFRTNNGRLVIIIGVIISIGFFGVLGVQISLSDIGIAPAGD